MSITIKEIEHLAKLSRLNLTDEEKNRLTDEMAGILDFAEALQKADLEDASPMLHIGGNTNVFREDKVCPSYAREDILKNAPIKDESTFLVPKTVEQGGE